MMKLHNFLIRSKLRLGKPVEWLWLAVCRWIYSNIDESGAVSYLKIKSKMLIPYEVISGTCKTLVT